MYRTLTPSSTLVTGLLLLIFLTWMVYFSYVKVGWWMLNRVSTLLRISRRSNFPSFLSFFLPSFLPFFLSSFLSSFLDSLWCIMRVHGCLSIYSFSLLHSTPTLWAFCIQVMPWMVKQVSFCFGWRNLQPSLSESGAFHVHVYAYVCSFLRVFERFPFVISLHVSYSMRRNDKHRWYMNSPHLRHYFSYSPQRNSIRVSVSRTLLLVFAYAKTSIHVSSKYNDGTRRERGTFGLIVSVNCVHMTTLSVDLLLVFPLLLFCSLRRNIYIYWFRVLFLSLLSSKGGLKNGKPHGQGEWRDDSFYGESLVWAKQ